MTNGMVVMRGKNSSGEINEMPHNERILEDTTLMLLDLGRPPSAKLMHNSNSSQLIGSMNRRKDNIRITEILVFP